MSRRRRKDHQAKQAELEVLQILVGVYSDESEFEAVRRGIALWHAEASAAGALVLADPIHTVEDVDPELNEGYSRVVNVCANVLRR